MPKFSRYPLVVAVAVAALLCPATVLAQTDAERERDRLQDQQEELAEEVDVLEASNEEIDAALDQIDGALAAQQARVDAADAARRQAETALADAEADLAAARHDVEVLEEAVREMAIASYIHPPAEDLVQSLTIADFSDALIARTYLDARAKRDVNLLDLLGEAEGTAERRAVESQQAADAAAEAAETASAELAGLQSEQHRQQQFAADLQVRIDDALAESAVLADIDAQLADEIAAEQAALIERLPPTPAAVPLSTDGTPAGGSPTSGAGSGSGSPTTTAPSPPVDTSAPPLRTVYGITVHADIAGNVEALVGAARSAGINLGGYGYRSNQSQIQLRMAHCGTSYYAIWEMPSSQCSPPTAPPGRSMHELGLAIDFTVDGRTITSRSSPGFQWLAANAGGYGLRNLPSEPWHWSTTGN